MLTLKLNQILSKGNQSFRGLIQINQTVNQQNLVQAQRIENQYE